MFVSKCSRYVIALVFTLNSVAFAQSPDSLGVSDIKQPQQASEYIFRSSPKESLISVQLLGAVTRPGIYYVPPSTDLLKLITLAGGAGSTGDMSEITVRKLEPKSWAEIKSKAVSEYQGAYEVDAEKVIKYGGAKQLKLAQDDFIYVPSKSYMVSSDATRTITVVSLVLGIALTALLIDKNSGHNGAH
ncbi:SLBB domain-containing protein [Bdellovibrio sp. HCB185ZH]|uniref:SLBB domain-containing protein n=1 Tax=Bdellovibrio sp. HCB185ZH TaxID=3394235 RepID=UPI0039A686CB